MGDHVARATACEPETPFILSLNVKVTLGPRSCPGSRHAGRVGRPPHGFRQFTRVRRLTKLDKTADGREVQSDVA